MSLDFEIIVGTYEQFLLGYKVHDVDSVYTLERSFATHSHLASIRSVASNKHYLASAGADDSVFLYDMRYRIESGRLMHHTDTVHCVTFTPDASHLLTASNDGSIGIVRCGNWQLDKHWTAPHKGKAVNTVAVHPTGKLAMSTGADGVLRTWNLIKGRQAYATNLVPKLKFDAKNVTIVRWSPNGEKYLIVSNSKIDVYSVETAGLCAELSFGSKVVCVEFIRDNVIAIGHEDGKIRFHDIVTDADTLEMVAHDVRVKCLAHRNNYLVSASSSGEIKLWRCGKKKLNILSTANCGARITCLTLTQPCVDLTVKKEEPTFNEEIDIKNKNVFRMRQEVIVEDEEDNTTVITQQRGKRSKKSAVKNQVMKDVPKNEDSLDKPNLKRKLKKAKVVPNETLNLESPGKKRALSLEKTNVISEKRQKKEASNIPVTVEVVKKENTTVTDNTVSLDSKKKNKKQKKVAMLIEKPCKPVSKKRKQQNVNSSTTPGFPSKKNLEESPGNKRALHIKEADVISKKKQKKEASKIPITVEVAKRENTTAADSTVSLDSKKNRKEEKKVAMLIEKPCKPVSKKRKQQNVNSSAVTGFPSKTKKKKMVR